MLKLQFMGFNSLTKKLERNERGAVLTETAIVLPLLAMLFLGLWEMGPHVSTHHTLIDVANVGARHLDRPGLTQDVECQVDETGTPLTCATDPGHLYAHDKVLTIMALQGFNSSLDSYLLKSIRNSATDTVTFTIEAQQSSLLLGIVRPVTASVTAPYLNNAGSSGSVSTESEDEELIDDIDDPRDEYDPYENKDLHMLLTEHGVDPDSLEYKKYKTKIEDDLALKAMD